MERTVTDSLNALKSLPAGWDYGQGIGCLDRVAEKALELVQVIKGYTVEVMPRIDGGVTLIFGQGVRFLDVSIQPDLRLDYRLEEGIGFDYSVLGEGENVSVPELQQIATTHLNH